ncbi:NUDIX domain-containing protein [Echinicola soli]|nr:NUDIX domain-containing protein [Echinicola soli]
MWDLPGGGLDHGQTADQGIQREMIEESISRLLSLAIF